MPIYPTQLYFALEKRFPHHPALARCVGWEVAAEHLDENDEYPLADLTEAINQAIIRIGGGSEIGELMAFARENEIDLEKVRADARRYYVMYL